ncbi:MAG: Tol-Pal system peptidoglycan-associated lipoprotein [Pseudomonadota bacterium]|jgi:peptidoglycan-associated lipoprotein
MLKQALIGSAVLAALLFTGCASKEEVAVKPAPAPKVEEIKVKETVVVEEIAPIGSVYFDFDKFGIRADQQGVVKSDVTVLTTGIGTKPAVQLQGNCDDRGTQEYNMALGLKRANAVKDAVVAGGVKADRLSVVSYGKDNQVCKEANEACWSKNRRVDFNLSK